MNHTVVIIGAGAAGLMAAIWAGRTHPHHRLIVLDGARKLGAKILVAGGGRCNVTHDTVTAEAYAGSSRNAIKNVLRRFDVPQTVAFFRQLGVELKREETGKLFPANDKADTILQTLLQAAQQTHVTIHHPCRVERVSRENGRFFIEGAWGELTADAVILATGGKSLPKSGSDGHGYTIAQSLGHTLTPHIFPALVPLTLPPHHFLCQLSGITLPATLELWSGSGKLLQRFTDSTLCTHFGLSGPSLLDISRYYLAAKEADSAVSLTINWLPGETAESVEQKLLIPGPTTLLKQLHEYLPERLIRALCQAAGCEAGLPAHQLNREKRKTLIRCLTRLPLPITGSRGYNYAEVTAGGVPLSEIHLKTMESRCCPGLYLCGEICDVDGRIGGYNFQWAWASGFVAGTSVLS